MIFHIFILILFHNVFLFEPFGAPYSQYDTLWEAVESEDTLAVQSLLSGVHVSCGGGEREREKVVNRVSEQGLVPLDVAALTHNSPLLHVLTKAGARHNPVCECCSLKPCGCSLPSSAV